jgi:hypothetical protein
MNRKSQQNSTSEPKVPANMQGRFEELVDVFMDKHNMTGDAARKRAYSELNLDKKSNKNLTEDAKKKVTEIKMIKKMYDLGLL